MRLIVLFLLATSSISTFAQTTQIETSELVFTFPSGGGNGQLGLNIDRIGDSENPSNAAGLLSDGQSWFIRDSVNRRIVITSSSFESLGQFPIGNVNFTRLWIDVDFVVGGMNGTGPDKFWNTTIIDRRGQIQKNVVLSFDGFLKNWEAYYYLFHVGNVLFFQRGNGNYFWVTLGLDSPSTSTKPQLFLNGNMQTELQKESPGRFYWSGLYLLDGNQLISRSSLMVFNFFKTLPNFDFEKFPFLPDLAYTPLPNGRSLFLSSREFFFFDKTGRSTSHYVLPVDAEYSPSSSLSPAADGYVYYFHVDKKNVETLLFRIGPFPELKLDYQGRGATLNDDNVNLREEASVKSAAVTKLAKGTPVRILNQTDKPETFAGQKDVWYQVRLWDRTEGWVFGAFLDVDK